ncbi:MAG: ABC transporter substrate-binding protein [Dorea sp.]|jgi:NitT/TauT family transport system substrate-binding protein|uniref:ABC transporter substrate-binding subunit SaoX n=1 Tax=Sporofaciens sp. JLR.KK001 TaxID=3112621 RepID=UPI00216C4DA2|nr:ABC transporter substrate-binding protein [Dorea sp.]
MKKKLIASLLAAAMLCSLLTACHNSSETNTVDVESTDFDPKKAVEDYEFGELSEEEKNYTVEMGYFNCDHMCASIIGEKSGIYEALGLKVNLTKSPETVNALISGAMDVGYIFFSKNLMSDDSPVYQAAANHLGGSRYLVVSNDIDVDDPLSIEGKTISMDAEPQVNSEWRKWSEEYGFSFQPEDYDIVAMGQKDAMFALKAGQIDAFTCCDPYASQAEFEGFGKIMCISWGANLEEGELLTEENAGTCCSYAMSVAFREKYPELARRLVYAHMLSVKYLYEHPYNAAMMFADGFDVDPYVGLRTVYMKTVAEGRTITWQWSEQTMQNNEDFQTQWKDPAVPEEDIIFAKDSMKSLELSNEIFEEAGVPDFDEFIKDSVEDKFPLGMTFEDWYNAAKKIDNISDEDAVDITDTATPYLNENLEEE